MGFITTWKEVTGLVLVLLHLVHATEQAQSRTWRRKKAAFIAPLWWLVMLTLPRHTHTHQPRQGKRKGLRIHSQLLPVIDPGLLITSNKGLLGSATQSVAIGPLTPGLLAVEISPGHRAGASSGAAL